MYRERVCWTRATVVRRWAENYGTYFGGSPRRGPNTHSKDVKMGPEHSRTTTTTEKEPLSFCLSVSLFAMAYFSMFI